MVNVHKWLAHIHIQLWKKDIMVSMHIQSIHGDIGTGLIIHFKQSATLNEC